MEDRRYAVVDVNSFSSAVSSGEIILDLLFDNILESNMDTLRYSIDGSLFVIKTNTVEKANYLRDKSLEIGVGYTEYSYEDVLTLMATPEWASEEIELMSSSSFSE